MDTGQYGDMLQLLKTVADENRLKMIGLMSERAYTVSEMAGIFNLTEPTVSHHVSKLHGAGLLRLRMEGNQRFYSLNAKRLETFKAYVNEIEKQPTRAEKVVSDTAWVEELDWSEADKKVLRDYVVNGRVPNLPSKVNRWVVILRWIATKFEPNKHYTEKQVNAILRDINEDYATLRRYMVDFGYMRREMGGGDYWLTPENEKSE
jgi:predicted transcriptional regulator